MRTAGWMALVAVIGWVGVRTGQTTVDAAVLMVFLTFAFRMGFLFGKDEGRLEQRRKDEDERGRY